MKQYTVIKIMAWFFFCTVVAGGLFVPPQIAQARDNDTEPGRILGAGQFNGDGFNTAMDGPPGSLDTGRYTGRTSSSNNNKSGIIKGDGFSINLTNPQTHGHNEDVGARAGWSWEF